jgi:PDZ domain-containing secreted protein
MNKTHLYKNKKCNIFDIKSVTIRHIFNNKNYNNIRISITSELTPYSWLLLNENNLKSKDELIQNLNTLKSGHVCDITFVRYDDKPYIVDIKNIRIPQNPMVELGLELMWNISSIIENICIFFQSEDTIFPHDKID